ncbi:MAG TPA: hypothetical protein VJ183_02045 [Chloroflexia bacterium]|nr:hypothetical protein [Chloroflexia bacterium]
MSKFSQLGVTIVAGLIIAAMTLLAACDTQAPPSVTVTPSVPSTPTDEAGLIEATTPTPIPSPTGLDEGARVDVYMSVVLEMLDKEGKEVGYVYISPYIGQGEHLDIPDEDTPIPSKLIRTLQSADGQSDRTFTALDFGEAVGPFEEGTKVANGGVFITLGPIVNDASDEVSVTVRASVYRDATSAEGNIYSLSRDPSAPTGWKLLTTIPEWTSNQ